MEVKYREGWKASDPYLERRIHLLKIVVVVVVVAAAAAAAVVVVVVQIVDG